MTPEQLVKIFDQFIDVPSSVTKLRGLLIQLAVQGKLVEQRPTERPAWETIQTASKALIDTAPDPTVDTPAGWVCVPLGRVIASNTGGGTPSKHNPTYWNGPIPWASVKDVGSDKYISSTIDTITEKGLRNSSSHLIPSNRLIVVTRMGLGKVAINTIPIAINQDLRAIEPTSALDLEFAYFLFKSIRLVGTGTTVKGVSIAKLHAIKVRIPPLREQRRIVAKLNQLMQLCDRLEEQQQKHKIQQEALAGATLARFTAAPTIENLRLLFQPSYNVAPSELSKAILNLAVQGKLASSRATDTRLEQSFPQLRRTEHSTVDVARLPRGWTQCDYHSLTSLVTSGSRGWKKFYAETGAIFIRTQNIKTDELVLDDVAFVKLPPGAEGTRTKVLKHDILITITGANVGKAALVKEHLPEAYVSQHIALTRPRWGSMAPWLHLCFISPSSARGALEALSYGEKPGLNLNNIRNLVLPIPPLREQHRILSKVAKLQALVKKLQREMVSSRALAAKLLDTLIARFCGPIDTPDIVPASFPSNIMKAQKRQFLEPLKPSTRNFVLRRFAMESGYRSLSTFDCTYHEESRIAGEASPICLVGLNGSGKSNLIEALADVFCFLELINLPWKRLQATTSRYRENRHLFRLDYTIEDATGTKLVSVRKSKKSGAEFYLVDGNGLEQLVPPGRDQLLLLPRRVVGYSSGLNETISHPFLRTKTLYSEEVRDAAPLIAGDSSHDDTVFDTRTLYMDYESNAAIIICNYIFGKKQDLSVFEEFTRVRGVSSFGLRFNRKRTGKQGPNRLVRLTTELESFLESFARCAGGSLDRDKVLFDFDYRLDPKTVKLFRDEFETSEKLFMAMHKWSLLNALILSDNQRKVYLRTDITKGALERPPSVPPSDRVFNIVDLKLILSVPNIEIDYSGLSDGEHQFIQVFGTTLLFSEPGTLFLFDEPESHFNPEWRTKFNLILNKLPNTDSQEFLISTHSPYIVSGSRKPNVYKFTRNGADITCAPVTFETYGASFDDLLNKLFSITSLIDQSARKELEDIIKEGNVDKMKGAVEDFAESKEKRRLYEALIKKEQS